MTSQATEAASAQRRMLAEGVNADKRRTARHRYWQGWRVSSIAEWLEEPRSTVQGWRDAEAWDRAQPVERVY